MHLHVVALLVEDRLASPQQLWTELISRELLEYFG